MQISARGSERSEPNVVPMIDVMLVLLIIFMVVTPFMAQGFTAEPPEAENFVPRPDDAKDLVLGIDAQGNYFLNKQPLARAVFPTEIGRLFRGRESKVLFLKADKNLDYGVVREAMDVASERGVHVVGMVTDKTPTTLRRAP